MSEFWLRETSFIGGGKEFRYPNYEVQFRVEFANGGDPDLAVVELYNLAPNTVQSFVKGQPATLRAGYQGDIGIVLLGEIRHIQEIDEGADRICEIEVLDTSEAYQTKPISESYVPGTTASQILDRVISMSGLEQGEVRLVQDVVYPEGRNVDGTINGVIKEIAKDCGSVVLVRHGMIHILPPGAGYDEIVVLSPKTGLLGSPKRIDEGDDTPSKLLWEVEALLNYRIRAGSNVQIESKGVNGLFTVQSGSHVSDGGEFKTTIKLAEPGGT